MYLISLSRSFSDFTALMFDVLNTKDNTLKKILSSVFLVHQKNRITQIKYYVSFQISSHLCVVKRHFVENFIILSFFCWLDIFGEP